MSIASLETKFNILKNLNLFANLLKSFSDSKKQLRYIRRMLHTYSLEANDKNFLIEEAEKEEIDYFITEIQKITHRLSKTNKPLEYKRLSQSLDVWQSELNKAIIKTEALLVEAKGRATLGNLFEKAKNIGDSITQTIENGIGKIKSTIHNGLGDSDTP